MILSVCHGMSLVISSLATSVHNLAWHVISDFFAKGHVILSVMLCHFCNFRKNTEMACDLVSFAMSFVITHNGTCDFVSFAMSFVILSQWDM